MANPPITIGPFTNVPAPGSPIASNWPQQISQIVASSTIKGRRHDVTTNAFGDVTVTFTTPFLTTVNSLVIADASAPNAGPVVWRVLAANVTISGFSAKALNPTTGSGWANTALSLMYIALGS